MYLPMVALRIEIWIPSSWKCVFKYQYFHFFFQCALETYYWTPLNHFFLWGSILIFFAIHALLYADALTAIVGTSMTGTLENVASTPAYWFGVLLSVILLLTPVVCVHLWRLITNSTLSDRLRLRASIARSKSQSKSLNIRSKTSIRREFRTQSIRSGYAFAHQEGFGEFITSGRYIRKTDSIDRPRTDTDNSMVTTNDVALNNSAANGASNVMV